MNDTYSSNDQQELDVHMQKSDQDYFKDKYKNEIRDAKKRQALKSVGSRGSMWDDDYEDQRQWNEKMFPEYWQNLDEK